MSKLREAVVSLVLLVSVFALPAVARSQTFETISVKPSASTNPRDMRVRIAANGDVSISSLHVFFLVQYAYGVSVQSQRLHGAEVWKGRELYDIEAKAPASVMAGAASEQERWSRVQKMLRALLADRFKLVMKAEQKTMPVYALTVASGGPKLVKSPVAEKDCVLDTSSPDSCHNFIGDRGHPLRGKAVTIDDIVQYVENWTDMPVVNQTGLKGLFALDTEGWKPMRLPPRPPDFPQAPNFDDLPPLASVLNKLGLDLKQQESTVTIYTVTQMERPSAP